MSLTLTCVCVSYAGMRPIEAIRKNVFRCSQAAFGEIAGTTQASVSRWETGQQEPSRDEMERIREAARARSLQWHDSWFFEVAPAPAEAA